MEKSEKFSQIIDNTENNIDEENEQKLLNNIKILSTTDYNPNNHNKSNNNYFSFYSEKQENEKDNSLYKSSSPVEEVFKMQKEKIKTIKEKYKSRKNNIKSANNHNKERNSTKENIKLSFSKMRKTNSTNLLCLTINDLLFFEQTIFNYNPKLDEDYIPLLNNSWEKCNQLLKSYKKNNFIELNKIAVRTMNTVNYNTSNIELNLEFSLTGESELWIFTRCFVNKDTNESYYFDTVSLNNDVNVIYNKYTSLIKIIKEKNSSKCFITFGTFYEDLESKGKIKYETFLKRQLVDYCQNEINRNNTYYYLENDLADFKLFIKDSGNDLIDAKISMNKNTKMNHIMGKFYLPTNKKAKLMFCGVGQSVKIKKLIIKNYEKNGDDNEEKYETIFSSEKKSCTCCSIY